MPLMMDVYEALPFGASEDAKPRRLRTLMVTLFLDGRERLQRVEEGFEGHMLLRGVRRDEARAFHEEGVQYVEEDAEPLTGSLKAPPPEPIPRSFRNHWRPSIHNVFGVGLQGGGLRGAFGVGALRFLAEMDLLSRERLKVIGSASTGSITGSILMLNQGSVGADKAVREYTRLRSYKDMLRFVPEVEDLKAKSRSVATILPTLLNEEIGMLDPWKILKQEIITSGVIATTISGGLGGLALGAAGGAAIGSVFGPAGTIIGGVTGGLIGLAAGGWAGLTASGAIEGKKDFDEIMKLFEIKPSLAGLEPVETALLDLVGSNDTRKAGIKWRISVNNMETGQTHYITERGTLLAPVRAGLRDVFHPSKYVDCKVHQIDGVDITEQTFSHVMIKAALTSGSFPGIFPPRTIRFDHPGSETTREEYFNDGGVRENLPLQAMIDAGAEQIVAIYCAPIEPAAMPFTDLPGDTADKPLPTWTEVAGRAVELTFAEITRTDVARGRRLNAGDLHLESDRGEVDDAHVDIVDIAPRLPTLGLTEIDPRKIEATLAYGYMCAYDEMWIAARSPDRDMRTRIRDNTDKIFANLALASDYSALVLTSAVYRNPDAFGQKWGTLPECLKDDGVTRVHRIAFQSHAIRVYSMAKDKVLEALIERVGRFGTESLPTPLKPHFLQRRFFDDWSMKLYPIETFEELLGRLHVPIRFTLNDTDFMRQVRLRTANDQEHRTELRTANSFRHRISIRDSLPGATFLS